MSLFRFPSCHWSNAPRLALLLLHHNTCLHPPPLPPPSAVTASLEEQPSLPEPPSLRTVVTRVKEKSPNVFRHPQIIETKTQTGSEIPHRTPNKNRSRSVTSRQLFVIMILYYYCGRQLQSHVLDLDNVFCPSMYDMILYLLLSMWSILELGAI